MKFTKVSRTISETISMTAPQEIAFVGRLLDEYAATAWRRGGAAEEGSFRGVPPSMQVGPIDEEGWVDWQVLPSTLDPRNVAALEGEFGIRFPPLFTAYLLARFHLFDQVKSSQYGQQILMTWTPAGFPLEPLRELLTGWQPLIPAGFVPFAQWGDGWGPMCFDTGQRREDGECPAVWLDHEELVPLGIQACQQRSVVAPLARPLYGSFREFLVDVFDVNGHSSG